MSAERLLNRKDEVTDYKVFLEALLGFAAGNPPARAEGLYTLEEQPRSPRPFLQTGKGQPTGVFHPHWFGLQGAWVVER